MRCTIWTRDRENAVGTSEMECSTWQGLGATTKKGRCALHELKLKGNDMQGMIVQMKVMCSTRVRG